MILLLSTLVFLASSIRPGRARLASAGSPARLAPDPVGVSPAERAHRRARILESMREGLPATSRGLLLLRAPPPAPFAGDVDFPYRADNDLVYLSGVDQPGCALLLSDEDLEGRGHAVLFLDEPGAAERLWLGERLDARGAAERAGLPAAAVRPLEDLPRVLRELLGAGPASRHGRPDRLWLETGSGFAPGGSASEPYRFLLDTLGNRAFHLELRSPAALILPRRQIKSPAEIAHIEAAVDATCQAIDAALRIARPGVAEFELRAEIEATFLRAGCRGWGFPSIVATGPNTCVLHYERHDRRSESGDLVLLDIGAEHGYYSADVSRTFPVNGVFSPRQRAIYEIVLAAQEEAIDSIRPGLAWREVHRVATERIARGLVELGVAANAREARRYFPHGTSHGLGLAVHDPMPDSTLAPGMVITVEPGIYIPEEAIGVRIEDDVLVTEDGHRVLSAAAPKSIEALERALRRERF